MENQEREISLVRLFWKIIFSWKALLISAVVFGVLLAAVFYWRDMKSYEEIQKKIGAEDAVFFSEAEKDQIKDAEILQQRIDENEEYMAESILMNLNHDEEHVLALRYYVNSNYQFNYTENNNPDYTNAVVAFYVVYAEKGDLVGKVIKELGLNYDEKYIKELVSVKATAATQIINIEIVYPDEEILLEIGDIIKKELNKKVEEVSANIGSHTLDLLMENITLGIGGDLEAKKVSNQDTQILYHNQLNNIKKSMTAEQLAELGQETKADILEKPGVPIKYGLLGCFIGLFLVVAWIIGNILFTGDLQDGEELMEYYGLRLFGIVQKQKKLSNIDMWLLKVKNKHEKQLELEQNLDIISSNIELACKRDNITKLYLTGTEVEKIDKDLIELIIHRLKNAGIEIIYGENICYDAASLRRMVEVFNVIIVEQTEISKYREIEKQIRKIAEQKAIVLGCIGINAKYV